MRRSRGNCSTVGRRPGRIVLRRTGELLIPEVERVLEAVGSLVGRSRELKEERPHQVSIQVIDSHVDASRVWVRGQVESSEFLGEFARYRVRVGEVAMLADQSHFAGLPLFQPGTEVRLGIEPSQVRFLCA